MYLQEFLYKLKDLICKVSIINISMQLSDVECLGKCGAATCYGAYWLALALWLLSAFIVFVEALLLVHLLHSFSL